MSKIDINILGNAIGKIADAVSETTKAISKYVSNSNIRRMQKCIRYGDKLVLRIRELRIEDKILDKYMAKWDQFNN